MRQGGLDYSSLFGCAALIKREIRALLVHDRPAQSSRRLCGDKISRPVRTESWGCGSAAYL